ncbi:uncharacterized protein LOC101474941 [Maylandia zebra]|uniref:uncharacterized protein LOC101474941 n=1 Tax=Maylandia zebra TaxID=106582 RepID=UPI0006455556|nr:uncharacterized protein LOC101474941 [Maylandia zebra]XP_024658277.1 uncharacterized protein LOC112434828 [Maylandia zebra]XP_026022739.1 uncharacterized protein LOC113022004 [Astatotilapia calliptera]
MKTLSAALVLLSLISVGQPASLACEKLLKPVDQRPDLIGRWHFIAVSTEFCLSSTLVSALFSPSAAVDVISKGEPNLYGDTTYLKANGVCINGTSRFLYANSSIFELDSENATVDQPDVLLHTGCPDCLVSKEDKSHLLLFSRRTAVSAAELTEFETQAECLGWSKPQLLNTDHDYEKCVQFDEDMDEDKLSEVLLSFFQKTLERMKTTYHLLTKCMAEGFISYYPSLF